METSHGRSENLEMVDPPVPALQLPGLRPKDGPRALLGLFLLALSMGLTVRFALPPHIRDIFKTQDVLHVGGAAALLAAVALGIVLHETGHLAAALLMNFRILGVALGPFRLTRSNVSWQFRFSPKSLFSGSVSAVPRGAGSWRERMLAVVAGGPVATLLTGGAAAAVLLCLPLSQNWIHAFLSAFTQLSAFIFALGLIPNSREARIRNDARLLLVLRHNSQEAREILLYHLLTQLELAATRPRDYPEHLMRELARTQGRPDLMLFSAHRIVLWSLDRGDLPTAEAWDRRCLELSQSCQPLLRNVALASSACLDVLVRNRFADAREKFDQVHWDSLSPAWLMHRSRAAYYLTAGNVPDCLAEVSRAQFAFPARLPLYAFERTLLSQLHRQALNLRPPELTSLYAA